jgi:hypothetical protein
VCEMSAISRRFERDLIPYALETDCPLGAAGFEPLHLEIRSAQLHPASTGFRRRSGAPLIRDAQVRVPPPGLRVLAKLANGLLHIDLVREVPEAMKPRAIPIVSSDKMLDVEPTKLAA